MVCIGGGGGNRGLQNGSGGAKIPFGDPKSPIGTAKAHLKTPKMSPVTPKSPHGDPKIPPGDPTMSLGAPTSPMEAPNSLQGPQKPPLGPPKMPRGALTASQGPLFLGGILMGFGGAVLKRGLWDFMGPPLPPPQKKEKTLLWKWAEMSKNEPFFALFTPKSPPQPHNTDRQWGLNGGAAHIGVPPTPNEPCEGVGGRGGGGNKNDIK